MQAHAWTALGKVCLVDEGLAKKCLPLFVQQLHRAASPAVSPAAVDCITQASLHLFLQAAIHGNAQHLAVKTLSPGASTITHNPLLDFPAPLEGFHAV